MADGMAKASQILSMTRESEILQSFLRVGLDSEPEETSGSRPRRVAFKKAVTAAVAIMAPTPDEPEFPESLQPSPEEPKLEAPSTDARHPRALSRNHQQPHSTPKKPVNSFTHIMREIKLRSMKKTPSKKSKGRQYEEVYTDKDRAAAVIIGGDCDIKTSLKMKKRQDRSAALQIPEETDSGALLALGNYEMRCGNFHIAIGFVDKALELNPSDKNALVARSKCYLLLGQPQLALQDAETALAGDKSFIRAIFQKAEALYHLGDFEHSLMYHHRGLRLRPELDGFRLGVQKAQQAIQNTIGKAKMMSSPEIESQHLNGSVRTLDTSDSKHSSSARSRPVSNTSNKQERRLLGELCVDKEYLEDLLKNPDIKCLHQDAANHIALHAEEGIEFLKTRQEFWRQQKPNKPSIKKSKKL